MREERESSKALITGLLAIKQLLFGTKAPGYRILYETIRKLSNLNETKTEKTLYVTSGFPIVFIWKIHSKSYTTNFIIILLRMVERL